MKWKKRLLWMAIIVLAAVGTGFLGYYLAQNQPSTILQEEEALSVTAEQERIEDGATITTKYTYTYCSHEEERQEEVSRELIGKTKEETEQYFSDFQLELFTRDEIRIVKKIDQYCAKHYLVKEETGKVVILRNIPGTENLETIEEAEGNLAQLLPKEREILQNGKVFSSENEAKKYLHTIANKIML